MREDSEGAFFTGVVGVGAGKRFGLLFSHTEKALEGLLGFVVCFFVVVGLFWGFLFFFLLGNCPF